MGPVGVDAAMGTILRVSVKGVPASGPGLPKDSVTSAEITARGLSGDFNRYRHEKLGDDPDSAVLVMPIETIEELAREGWPMAPGDFGENLTLRGIPYRELAPGARLRGREVLLEVSRACVPCTNLYSLPYVGPTRGPAFLRATLGRRGWYARVLTPGRVAQGESLALEPAPDDPAPPTRGSPVPTLRGRSAT